MITTNIIKLYTIIFVCIVFFVGGTIQFVGLISNTETTILLICLFTIIILLETLYTLKIKIYSFDYLILCISLVIILSSFLNSTSLMRSIGYFIYILVPFLSYRLVKYIFVSGIDKTIIKIFISLAFIQLPIIIIQRTFYADLAFIHGSRIIEEDVGFGTFFIANDVGLCFFLISLIIVCLFNGLEKYHVKIKKLIIIPCVVTIFATNSKASILLLILIFVYYAFYKLYCSHKKTSILLSFIFIISLLFYLSNIDSLSIFDNLGIVGTYEKFESKEYGGGATLPRFAPIIIFLNQPLKFIGEGPYNFYDPLTKVWRYGSGHSQIFWTYNDIGIIGLFFSALFLFSIAFKNRQTNKHYLLYFFVVCLYSIVTTTLSDLSIMFSYIFFASIMGKRSTDKFDLNDLTMGKIITGRLICKKENDFLERQIM